MSKYWKMKMHGFFFFCQNRRGRAGYKINQVRTEGQKIRKRVAYQGTEKSIEIQKQKE